MSQAMQAEHLQFRKLALQAAKVADPRYLAVPVFVAAAARGGGGTVEILLWTAMCVAFTLLPVLIFVVVQVHQGAYTSMDIERRSDRHAVYALGIVGVLCCLAASFAFGAPRAVVAVASAMLLAGIAGALANLCWKVSIHTGSTSGAAIAFLALVGPIALPLVTLVPLIGWSRVTLGRHTVAEVITGGLLSSATSATVFWFFTPL